MGRMLDFYTNSDRFKDKVNLDVIKFIDKVSDFPDRQGNVNENIDHLFCAGYCYYFANMLKLAFGGKVCWVKDRGHIVWADCNEDCSFEELQSKPVYDITGIYDDYERLWPIEYLGKIVVDYMHNGKEFHLNDKFKDWCNFYNVSECFAIDIIWGIILEEYILYSYQEGMNYVQTAYRYWLSNQKEFQLVFELIKRHKGKLMFPKHSGVSEFLNSIESSLDSCDSKDTSKGMINMAEVDSSLRG